MCATAAVATFEIALDPVFADKHDYKLAALGPSPCRSSPGSSLAICALLLELVGLSAAGIEPGLYFGDLRLLLLLVGLSAAGIANAIWPRRATAQDIEAPSRRAAP